MNLFMMTPIFAEQHCNKVPISEIPTGEPYYVNNIGMDSTDNLIFNLNFIFQLDGMFMRNNIKHLTIEQERYIRKFLKEASIFNDDLDEINDDTTLTSDEIETKISKVYAEDLSEIMQQLDSVLAKIELPEISTSTQNTTTTTTSSGTVSDDTNYSGTPLVSIFENVLKTDTLI